MITDKRERYLKMMPKEIVKQERAKVKAIGKLIKDKGISHKDISFALKITRRTLIYKLNFENDFSAIEMATLVEYVGCK